MVEPNSTSPRGKTKGRKGNPSITRHPLFPAIVALWFAALLGLGSFALSTSLIENLVLATHIDAIVPAAAPPLGVTARLGVALLFGLFGAAVGFVLAQRLGRTGDKPAQHVFKVAETDLPASFDAPFVAPIKEDAPAPSDRLAALIAEAIIPPAAAPAAEPAPASEITIEHEGPVLAAPAPEPEIAPEPVAVEPPATPVLTAAQRIAAADLAELSHVELVERLAIALQRRQERREDEEAETIEAPNPVLHFPDFADRRGPREVVSATPSRPAPQQTERALREALAALQKMSGTA